MLLTSLIVVAVVIGLQTVGVVLMVAMLIGPAAAARQWTEPPEHDDRALAALFGALAGVAGAMLSVTQARLPTGPMIILALTVIVIVSLSFAPARGLVWDWRAGASASAPPPDADAGEPRGARGSSHELRTGDSPRPASSWPAPARCWGTS